MAEELDKVRVDKWLWAVRLFKSRTLAGEVCRQGHVKVEGKTLKPSTSIERGTVLQVRRNGYNMQYKVLDLIQKRVGAPIAQKCYEDLTPEEELRKFDDWYLGKAGAEVREKGAGRPTKRERREIEEFKGYDAEMDWGWIDEDDD
jgi:ribosome-associated heat shock protein Hsp15